ncbi:hypothetical protein GCM10022393_15590 [Aquimarina addita]|uniref:Carrier domain-containing protein n=1 Tax=Aquimarina addita TaxID=870485 RepID=A0ABP7XH16_9FLAO
MKSEELVVKSHKLWSDILKNDKICRQEDFFDQGGTSLSLIELISKTRKQFSVDLKASDFEEGLSLELYETLIIKSINQESQKVVL